MRWLLVLTLLAAVAPARAQQAVRLHAAGSLRAALTEVGAAFQARTGAPVDAVFGASGLLHDRIAAGEPAEVFASANLQHPLALAAAGRGGPVALFARNRLCALVRPGLDVDPATLVDRMLDPAIKLGTSTPGADPAGDYAWEAFRKVDRLRPGAFTRLETKALRLTGGPGGGAPPGRQSVYGAILVRGDADVFLAYCTAAAVAVGEVPGARSIALPDEIAVGAEYGLTVLNGASPRGYELSLFILSLDGQAVLARHGFGVPDAAR